MEHTTIVARDIPDAWYQALYGLVDGKGYMYKIQQGSFEGQKRLEYPSVQIIINYPLSEPFVPEFPHQLGIPPIVDMEYIYDYFTNNLMNDELPDNTVYTYGQRICYPMTQDGSINQLDLLCERLVAHPHSNQLVLRVSQPIDLALVDPPCLNFVQCKVIEDVLDFHIHFRSNDLWNGFVANMGGLALLMKYVAMDTKLKPGKFVYWGSGLHIYEHCFDVAKLRLYRDSIST